MKVNVTNKKKLWIILTVAILVIGTCLFSFLDFNQSVDYKNSNEVVITAYDYNQNIDDVKQSAETYFEQVGVKPVSQAEQVYQFSTGFRIVYKFNKSIDAVKNQDLTTAIEKVFDPSANVYVEVECNDVIADTSSQVWWVILGVSIVAIASFLYVLIFEKFSGAITMSLVSIIATLLFVSLMGITRIPAKPYLDVMAVVVFAISSVLSAGMINRFKEEIRLNDSKLEKAEKLSNEQIADKAAGASVLRFAFVLGSILIFALALLIFGTNPIRFLALQIILADVCVAFASFVGTPVIWSSIKNCKKKKS